MSGLSSIAVALVVLQAANGVDDADSRFRNVADKLVKAINANNQSAIQNLFDPVMQKALPPEKTRPFFRGVLREKGKLTEVGDPSVSGATATLLVKAKRGAWEFRITLDEKNRITGLLVTMPKPKAPVSERISTEMSLPFRDEWHVYWGGDTAEVNIHINTPGQRRAADLIVVDARGRSHRAQGNKNEDYYAYGKDILAPANGTVVTVIDGVPDNSPGSLNPLSAVGNCLIIQYAPLEFAVLAHFKPYSIRVKPGDKVRRGQFVGLCGNSGNSSEPHLHFHLQNSATLQDGIGFTPILSNVRLTRQGKTSTQAEYTFLKGDRVRNASDN